MKNIILQHWDGDELPDWAVTASKTMSDYATKCGADYRLLHGTPLFDVIPEGFCNDLSIFELSVHKLAFLSEDFDKYDQVCVYDMDMCATPWAKNVFDDPGSLSIWHVAGPSMVNSYRYSRMLTGAVYKFNRQQRKALRDVLLKLDFNHPSTFSGSDCRVFSPTLDDESVLAVLLHHPDCTLDPASLKQVDVRFEAVMVGVNTGSGRGWRPSKDSEVSVRHFMGLRKLLIIPVVNEWNGKKGLNSKLRDLGHRWQYSRLMLLEYLVLGRVYDVLVWIRRHSLAFSSLPLEQRADVY